MKIVNEATLARFRGPGRCQVCLKLCRRREAAHVRAKGLGAGHRLDVSIGLVACGLGAWSGVGECCCHRLADLNPAERTLLKIVASREWCEADDIEHALFILDRLRGDGQRELERQLDGVPLVVVRLVVRELSQLPDYWRRIEPLPGWDCCKVEPCF